MSPAIQRGNHQNLQRQMTEREAVMRKAIIVASAVMLLNAGASSAVLADGVTDCAKIEGKALSSLFVAIFKEAGRACGQGSSMNPQAVSQAAVGIMTGKLFAAVGKGVDKSGPGSCFITLDNIEGSGINAGLDSILSSTRSFADSLCLVP